MGLYSSGALMVLKLLASILITSLSLSSYADDKELKTKFESILNKLKNIESTNHLKNEFNQLDEFDYDDDSIDNIKELINKKFIQIDQSIYKNYYFFSLSLDYWSYSLKIKRDQKSDVSLLSNQSGKTIGFGTGTKNYYHNFNISFQYSLMNATITSINSSDASFSQKDIPIDVYMLNLIYAKRLNKNAEIELGSSLNYHNASFDHVDDGEIIDNKKTHLGYLIGLRWLIDSYSLYSRIGQYESYPSANWSFGLQYNF